MKKLFDATRFTPTEWDTAEDKAKFANQFVRFVESDFKGTLFPKWFYNRLSMTFGHIAHYNQGGFYGEFFTNTRDKMQFLKQTAECGCYGSPEFTYCDVERVVKAWVITSGLIEAYSARLNAEIETSERAQLDRLKAKYEAPKA
jgi:hypothetical protein